MARRGQQYIGCFALHAAAVYRGRLRNRADDTMRRGRVLARIDRSYIFYNLGIIFGSNGEYVKAFPGCDC